VTEKLFKVEADTPVRLLRRWVCNVDSDWEGIRRTADMDAPRVDYASYLVGEVVEVHVTQGGGAITANIITAHLERCGNRDVEFAAVKAALVAEVFDRTLVYIDRTGGDSQVSTSGPVEVLELDFDKIEAGEDVHVPSCFLEAFPFLKNNLEQARVVGQREGAANRTVEQLHAAGAFTDYDAGVMPEYATEFWVDADGRQPAEFTVITAGDVLTGKYRLAVQATDDAEALARHIETLRQLAAARGLVLTKGGLCVECGAPAIGSGYCANHE
jgi:hypothetical protein